MLKSLEIKKLFGYKDDINIDFNEDITLLIGRNGSGKTTVLNILDSIISGNFSFLTKYKFQTLILKYSKDKIDREILLEYTDFEDVELKWKNHNMIIKVDDLRVNLLKTKKLWTLFSEEEQNDYINEDMSSSFSIFKEISKDFEKVYLPLSRNIGEKESKTGKFVFNLNEKKDENIINLDESLVIVDELVKQKQLDIMLEFDTLNKQMQQEMFRSSFTFDEAPHSLLPNLDDFSGTFSELKDAFKEMGMLNEGFVNQIDKFYSQLENANDTYNTWIKSKKSIQEFHEANSIFAFIRNSSQIKRINEWKEIVIKRNKKKNIINKPMETFFQTLNSYLKDSGKRIEFDTNERKLLFYSKNSKGISTKFLSSGEKHVLIFFAYLILGMNNKRGIFIVDEPELSLHLKWQERFSSDLLKVAPDLQIIFATHSPEIVGKHRTKIAVLGGDHA